MSELAHIRVGGNPGRTLCGAPITSIDTTIPDLPISRIDTTIPDLMRFIIVKPDTKMPHELCRKCVELARDIIHKKDAAK